MAAQLTQLTSRRLLRKTTEFILFGFSLMVSAGEQLIGFATVLDGDTIIVDSKEVQLWGIDAPELTQTCEVSGTEWKCGESAAFHLQEFVAYHQIDCWQKNADHSAKAVSKCTIEGLDLGAEMIESGFAVPLWPVSKNYYLRSYKEARGLRRGMHRGVFENPWQWRLRNKL